MRRSDGYFIILLGEVVCYFVLRRLDIDKCILAHKSNSREKDINFNLYTNVAFLVSDQTEQSTNFIQAQRISFTASNN